MKNVLMTTVAALALITNVALADDRRIVLPRGLPHEVAELHEEFWRVFEATGPGDRMMVIDATDRDRPVANIEVPLDPKLKRVRRRARKYGAENGSVGAYLERIAGNTNVGYATVDLPTVLRMLGDNRLNTDEIDLLIIATPLHIARTDASFSMLTDDGDIVIPSDGHLLAPLAQTPYGQAGRMDGLKNVYVHFCPIIHPSWSTDQVEAAMQMWGHYIQLRGGSLVTWEPALSTCMERFRKNARQGVPLRPLKPDDSIAMLGVKRQSMATPEDFDRIIDEQPWLSDEAVITTTPPSTEQGTLKVGVRWDCPACDIDIYARSGRGNPWVYYGNRQSQEASFYKDFTSSPDVQRGLEIIEFKHPVELGQVQVRVNLFSGETDRPVRGTIRAFFNGRTYEGPFEIDARRGNQGAARNSASSDPHWQIIDLREVTGLQPRQG